MISPLSSKLIDNSRTTLFKRRGNKHNGNVQGNPNCKVYEEYTARKCRHLQNDQRHKSLPCGFPEQLNSNMVWKGDGFSFSEHECDDGTDCILVLNESQLSEIHAAVKFFHSLGKPLPDLCASTFPLPSLHPVLRSVSENIHTGYGFTLIRGIPVDQYSREECVIIYVGISSHIGSIFGRQDGRFEGQPADVMMAHITDFRESKDDQRFTLVAYTDSEVIFHTDVGDVVSLFALGEPASGGESQIASGWKVYNELAQSRPDLIHTLADNWLIPSAKSDTMVQRPLLFYQPVQDNNPERVIIQFSRRSFSGFGSLPQSKFLNESQAEALDALHFLAEKFHIPMKLKKGDMQFINNLSTLHARNSYVDNVEHRRHLLRLWIRDPENAWTTPEPMRERWNRIYDSKLSQGPRVFPLQPVTRSVGEQRKDVNKESASNKAQPE